MTGSSQKLRCWINYHSKEGCRQSLNCAALENQNFEAPETLCPQVLEILYLTLCKNQCVEAHEYLFLEFLVNLILEALNSQR